MPAFGDDVCLCHYTALFQYQFEQGDPGGRKALCKETILAKRGAATEPSGQAVQAPDVLQLGGEGASA